MAKKKNPGTTNLADFMAFSLIFIILSFIGIYLVLILSYLILAKREEAFATNCYYGKELNLGGVYEK